MKNVVLKKSLALLLSVMMLLSTVITGISVSAEDTAEATTVTVLQDGSTVGWFEGKNHSVVANVKDAVEGKTVVAVSDLSEFSGIDAIKLDSLSLSDAGITDATTLKTLSMYLKNPSDKTLQLCFGTYTSSAYVRLLGGTYYLVSEDDVTVKDAVGYANIPAGFEGYLLCDLTTFEAWETILTNDFKNAAVFDSIPIVGTTWFYGEIGVSTATPDEVAKLYVANASTESVKVDFSNDTGTPGYVWSGSAKNTLLNGRNVIEVTPTGANSNVKPSKYATDLTGIGVDNTEVNAISYYVNNAAEGNGTLNVRLMCYADSGWHNYTLGSDVPVQAYDINDKVLNSYSTNSDGMITLPSGFEGYVIFDIATARANSKLGSFFDHDLQHILYGATAAKKADGTRGTFYVAELSVWTASVNEALKHFKRNAGDLSAAKVDFSNDTGNPGYVWNGSAKNTVLNGRNVIEVTPSGANTTVTPSVYNTTLTQAGIEHTDIKAVSYYVNNAAEGNSTLSVRIHCYKDSNTYHEYYLKGVSVQAYDINTNNLTSYTTDTNGLVTLPSGFEGYLIYDIETARNNDLLGDFFTHDWEHIRYRGTAAKKADETRGTFYFAELSVWTASVNEALKYYMPEQEETVSYYDSIVWNSGDDTTSSSIRDADWIHWSIAADSEVSPYGNAYHASVAADAGAFWAQVYPKGMTFDNTELSEQSAIAFWLKVPEGVKHTVSKDVVFNTYESAKGNVYSGVRTFINTKTGEMIQTEDSLALTDFEGYVIFDLENSTINSVRKEDVKTSDSMNTQEFLKTYGFTSLSIFVTKYNVDTNWYLDNYCFVKDTDEFIGGIKDELSISSVDGDANGDGLFDVRDLVALKKFVADLRDGVNIYGASIDGNYTVDAVDLTVIRMILLGVSADNFIEMKNQPVGSNIFHLDYNNWDNAYGETYGDESTFINYYTTKDPYTLSKIEEQGGKAWYYIAYNNIFTDAENPTVMSETWKTNLDNSLNTLDTYGVLDTVVGFMTEEWDSKLTNEQIAVVYNYLKETYPSKRIFAVLTVNAFDDGATDSLKAAYKKVTDIGYDWYGSNDIEEHRAVTAIMNEVASNSARKWFFPLSNKMYDNATPEYMLAHIDMCYTLLKEQTNQGGLSFYNWTTWSKDGLETLLVNNPEYSVVYERIVEIGKEILAQ